MIRIAGKAVANYFTVDFRAALLCCLILFQNDNTSTFAQNKTVTPLFKRTRGPVWIIVSSGKRLHYRKTADTQRSHCRFGPPGNHGVSVAALDNVVGVTDGVGPGGARGDRGDVGSLGTEAYGNMSRRQVYDQHRDEKRGNLFIAAFVKQRMISLDGRETSKTGPDKNPHTLGVGIVDHQSGIVHGQLGGSDCVVDKEIHLLDLFLFDVILGIEIPDLAGNSNRQTARVKPGNLLDTRLA